MSAPTAGELLARSAIGDKGAYISECGLYRYSLWRVWDRNSTKGVVFIGLNPSTADATVDDATIRKCVGYGKAWGYGALLMLNLFAFRARDPKRLLEAEDPVGPENDRVLSELAGGTLTILCWGVHGALRGRDQAVLELLRGRTLHTLGRTKAGHPKHPLYLPGATKPAEAAS